MQNLHLESSNEKLRGCVRGALMNMGDYSFLRNEDEGDFDKENARAKENQPASEKNVHAKKKLGALKTITIKIDGLSNEETRHAVERQLIAVKGVISVTLDMVSLSNIESFTLHDILILTHIIS